MGTRTLSKHELRFAASARARSRSRSYSFSASSFACEWAVARCVCQYRSCGDIILFRGQPEGLLMGVLPRPPRRVEWFWCCIGID